MPQTREHMDIVGLLGVKSGLVALTKVDLVDAEWLELVRQEIDEYLAGTFLAGARVVPVSAVTGEGLVYLVRELDRLFDEATGRPAAGPARLPVDRVFSVAGFGTVVTGTLVSGTVRTEDRLELLPPGAEVRVRQVQVFGRPVDAAVAGQRVALNVANVDRDAIRRGFVLARPGTLRPGYGFAGSLRLLASAANPLVSGARVHLHTGTSEVIGRAVLLDRDELAPGETCYIRFRSEGPLVVGWGDRFIIRSYSPVFTIGGGAVVDPVGRYRRYDAGGLAELAVREQGSPAQIVAGAVFRLAQPVAVAELARQIGLGTAEVAEEAARLAAAGDALLLAGGEYVIGRAGYEEIVASVTRFLAEMHRSYPLRRGVSREELRRRLFGRVEARAFNELMGALAGDGLLTATGDRVALAGFQVTFTPRQAAAAETLVRAYLDAGFSPPGPKEALAGLGLPGPEAEDLYQCLVEEGTLVQVAPDVTFHRDHLAAAEAAVRERLAAQGKIAVGDLRDALGTSRRYAVPLLEYFDARKVTRRVGDERIPYR